jgi:hypothetical protein
MGGVVEIDSGNRSVPTACTGWSVTDELWAELESTRDGGVSQ